MTKKELLGVGLLIGVIGLFAGYQILQAREGKRDLARLYNMRELQFGLELYFNEHAVYPGLPTPVALGGATTACLSGDGFSAPCAGQEGSPYIEFVPASEDTGLHGKSSCGGQKNAYCYATDGDSFGIQFELEAAHRLMGLARGANCATDQGLEPGPCKAYATP